MADIKLQRRETGQDFSTTQCMLLGDTVANSECLTSAEARGVDAKRSRLQSGFGHRPMLTSSRVFVFQYGTNKCASQKGMTPYGLARQIKPDPSG